MIARSSKDERRFAMTSTGGRLQGLWKRCSESSRMDAMAWVALGIVFFALGNLALGIPFLAIGLALAARKRKGARPSNDPQ